MERLGMCFQGPFRDMHLSVSSHLISLSVCAGQDLLEKYLERVVLEAQTLRNPYFDQRYNLGQGSDL